MANLNKAKALHKKKRVFGPSQATKFMVPEGGERAWRFNWAGGSSFFQLRVGCIVAFWVSSLNRRTCRIAWIWFKASTRCLLHITITK